ncbi:MAG: MFS transporter, partial [Chloroflexota bacterium]
DLVPEGKRGLASGVKGLLEILGGIALVRLVGYYMGRYFTGEGGAWLWPMVAVLAVVLLGAGLATVLLVRERPGTGGPGPPLWPVLRRSFRIDTRLAPGFSRFLVSRLLVLMAFATLQRFALYFLQDVVGVANPALVTADMIIVIGVGMLLAVYPAGRLSDRVGRWPVVMVSGFVGVAGVVVLLFAHGYGLVVLGGGLLGISSGAFLSTDWALATDLVARGEEARYLGLTNLATAGGATLALFIIGPAIDFFNAYRPGLGYTVMLLACLAYFVAGSVLVVRLGRPQPR